MAVVATDQKSNASVGPDSGNLIRTDAYRLTNPNASRFTWYYPVVSGERSLFLSHIPALMTFYVRRVRCDGNDEITRLTKELTMGGMRETRLLNMSVKYLGF